VTARGTPAVYHAAARAAGEKLATLEARAEGEIMQADITLAGFMLTVEEWEQLDLQAREELVTASIRRDEPWVVRRARGLLADRPVADAQLSPQL
jgi:hypothetical protein